MTNNINKLIELANQYDQYVEYIDYFKQYKHVLKQNESIVKEAIKVASSMGLTMSKDEFITVASKTSSAAIEEAVNNFINSNNQEEKKMSKKVKNDYTLGGLVESTTWPEFIAICKTEGIDTTHRKFVDLSVELKDKLSSKKAAVSVPEEKAASVMSAEENKAPEAINDGFVLGKSKGEAIVRRIVCGGVDRNGKAHTAAMFKATKSKDPEVNGRYMVTMAKLYAIIADVYGLQEGDPNNDDFIKKGVINYLCRNGWLTFKRYEGGGISFFPTVKMSQYIKS